MPRIPTSHPVVISGGSKQCDGRELTFDHFAHPDLEGKRSASLDATVESAVAESEYQL